MLLRVFRSDLCNMLSNDSLISVYSLGATWSFTTDFTSLAIMSSSLVRPFRETTFEPGEGLVIMDCSYTLVGAYSRSSCHVASQASVTIMSSRLFIACSKDGLWVVSMVSLRWVIGGIISRCKRIRQFMSLTVGRVLKGLRDCRSSQQAPL